MWLALIVLLVGIVLMVLSFVIFPALSDPAGPTPRPTAQLAGVILGAALALIGLIMVIMRAAAAGP